LFGSTEDLPSLLEWAEKLTPAYFGDRHIRERLSLATRLLAARSDISPDLLDRVEALATRWKFSVSSMRTSRVSASGVDVFYAKKDEVAAWLMSKLSLTGEVVYDDRMNGPASDALEVVSFAWSLMELLADPALSYDVFVEAFKTLRVAQSQWMSSALRVAWASRTLASVMPAEDHRFKMLNDLVDAFLPKMEASAVASSVHPHRPLRFPPQDTSVAELTFRGVPTPAPALHPSFGWWEANRDRVLDTFRPMEFTSLTSTFLSNEDTSEDLDPRCAALSHWLVDVFGDGSSVDSLDRWLTFFGLLSTASRDRTLRHLVDAVGALT
jgi:hypothetical protein